jgi:hypothetical protein
MTHESDHDPDKLLILNEGQRVEGDSDQTLGDKAKVFAKKLAPYALAVLTALGYMYVPFVESGMEWAWGFLILGLGWLWINGYALPVLAGVLIYLTDTIVGVRLRTGLYNMSTVRKEKKRSNLGKGFIHKQSWVNEISAAAAAGVVYMFIKLIWFTEPVADEADVSLMSLLLDWRAHLELLEISVGVLLGIFLAPYLGKFLRQLVVLTTFNEFLHFEKRPYIGAAIRGVGNLLSKLNQSSHLDNVLSDEEVAANEHAIGLDRAVWAPLAIGYNLIMGVLRFLFAPGHKIFGVGLRVFVWIALLMSMFWMVELIAPAILWSFNKSLYIPAVLFAFAVLWFIYWTVRSVVNIFTPEWAGQILGIFAFMISGTFVIKSAAEFDYYTHLYNQHAKLEIITVTRDTMPITVDPRLYALGVIQAGMDANHEFDVERVSSTSYVTNGDEVRWTALIEKMHLTNRLQAPDTAIYTLPVTETGLTFSAETGQLVEDVCFDVAEHGYSGRNTYNQAYRSLPTELLVTHQPHEMKPMLNDEGEWVQVVSINRYADAPLRRKAFGGVVIIPQCDEVQKNWLQNTWVNRVSPEFAKIVDDFMPMVLHREVFGIGVYVSRDEIVAGAYPFLQGNNLVAQSTARRIAESFRFHQDVWAPLSNTRVGDVRIADRVEDRNSMPHFGMWAGMPGRPESAIYANVILQPRGAGAENLAYELWIPADGASVDGRPIVYMLDAKAEGMSQQKSVDIVAAQVRSLLPDFDWEQFEVVETTSYKRELGGAVRSLMLARVVPKRSSGALVLNDKPVIAVYDPVFNSVHQLSNPEASIEELDAEMLAAFGERWDVASK